MGVQFPHLNLTLIIYITMGKSKEQFLHLRQSRKEQRHYSVQDVINAEINLEPLECVNCSSTEVTYHQYVGDAYCSDCGTWQEEYTELNIAEQLQENLLTLCCAYGLSTEIQDKLCDIVTQTLKKV